MVRAAARGAIDFRRSDPRSPRWWTMVRLILDELENQDGIRMLRLHHEGTAAILARSDLTAESIEKLRDARAGLLAGIRTRLFPWEKAAPDSIEERADQLRRTWIETWGDPEDPEVAQAIEKTAAAIRATDRAPGPRS